MQARDRQNMREPGGDKTIALGSGDGLLVASEEGYRDEAGGRGEASP